MIRTALARAALLGLTLLGGVASAAEVVDLRGKAAEDALVGLRDAIARNPEDLAALRDAGIVLHNLSREKPDPARVEEAEGYLERARKLAPEDLEVQAWLGSVITMKALFVDDPGKQTFFVKSGTRLLDRAVREAPDAPVLRLIRGHNSMELPVFLKRTRFAVEDFGHYLALCGAGASCPPHQVALARERLAEAERIVAAQR